jgi:hypothetical protein
MMNRCPVCGRPEEIGVDPASVPLHIQPAMVQAVDAAVAEAMGRQIRVDPGGQRDCGIYAEHIPCDVLTKARRLVAARFGARMEDE